MRAQKRRRAFTLVELIIGMVMMVIVMGGIITGLSMGLRLYGRAEANGKVTNGARFTAASFKHKIWPMMSRASIVEILPNLPDIAVSDSEDCYVYLDELEQCVKYRIGDRDEPLAGSEFITSLDFSVPTASEDLAENFILRMRVEAQAPRIKSAHVTLDIDSALINMPAKRGSETEAAAYRGPVLHFNIFDFRDLQLRNLSDDNKILQNEETVEKDSVIQLRYNIIVPSGNKDATKTLYYISSESKASLKKSTGYWEDDNYNDKHPDYYDKDTRGNYCWPLVIKSGDVYYLAGDQYKKASGKEDEFLKIPTSGTFYVYTGNNLDSDFDGEGKLKKDSMTSVERFGSFGYLRAWVVPAYSDTDGGSFVRPKGYEQWSVRVRILQSNPDGQTWFRRFTQHQVDLIPNKIHLDSTDSNFSAVGYINPETGEYRVKMEYNTGNNHIQIGGALLPEDIGDARKYDKEIYDGVSYTNITNYSIIVDAEAGTTTAGLALLLNGYMNNGATSGYCLYYDPGANGYPIRLQNYSGNVGNYNNYGVREIDSPIESAINDTLDISKISGLASNSRFYGSYYNPQYVNIALQNDIFQRWESHESTLQTTIGDKTQECSDMQPRRRYMVTILEYHTGKRENPRLLVRMRLLKNLSEVMKESKKSERELRAEDPFLCGPRFYYSEPAWYGNFVGQKPKYSGDDSSKTFTFKVKRAGADEISFERTITNRTDENSGSDINRNYKDNYYEETSSYYAVQTPNRPDKPEYGENSRYRDGFSRTKTWGDWWAQKTIKKTFNGGVYKAKALDPREELGSTYDNEEKLGKLGADRYRWIGLAIWGGKIGNRSSVEIYDMTIAPGFDAGELRSIMESGAQVFGMDETNGSFPTVFAEYSADRDTAVKWNHELFGISSDGNGNQAHGNVYAGRFKNAQNETQPCVMSLQHVSLGYDDKCGCPMCIAYGKYNKK